ncbi:MAG: YceI family protein [Hyphomonadaceae bacterium]|nr:YceI family protein [Hyphomonadaceae bacterium]
MRHFLASLCLGTLALAGCVNTQQSLAPIDSSNFELDRTHAFLSATVVHFGLSDYTIDFTDFDAQLDFDAEDPTASVVSVQLNPAALATHYPDPEKRAEWEDELANDGKFLNAGEFPSVTFVSTSASQTGEFTGTLTGDLNMRGATTPITLNVTYTGTATSPLDGGRRRVGFNASGTFSRSDFGITAYSAFVSDEVTLTFSGEFLEAE